MSYKLIIKKQDNSIYATEYFNLLEDAQKWLNEEKTRKYWDENYTSEFVDTTIYPTQSEIDAAEAIKLNHDLNLQKIRSLKGKDLSSSEVKTAVMAILELLGL